MSKNNNFNNDSCHDPSANIGHCSNEPVEPDITEGTIYAKVPVVLAELKVKHSLSCHITLPERALEIKDIKKRLEIVQCRLLLPSNQLFIKGFIRKNIKYAAPLSTSSTLHGISSQLRSFTTRVPFHCVTTITDYLTEPVQTRFNMRKEFDFFVEKDLGPGFPEKDKLLSSDLSQFHQESKQFFNELPFCELLSSKIVEWDEATDRITIPGHVDEGTFRNVVEKVYLEIELKVLQNQQIRVISD